MATTPSLDTLIGPNAPTSMTSALSNSSVTLPAWLQDITRSMAGQAIGVAGQQYHPYNAPDDVATYGQDTGQIAGFDPAQTQSFQNTEANQGNWRPFTDYASQTTPEVINRYMSPYMDSVVNRISQLGQRNLSENLLPQVNSTFTGAGQFGSSRNRDFTNQAVRDANESILGQQANSLQTGYQNAQQAASADLTRIGNLGGQVQQYAAQDAGLLGTVGQQRQALAQQNMALANQDWGNQNNHQRQQLDWLSQIVRGLPAQSSTYATNTQIPAASQTVSPLAAAAQGFSGARALTAPTPTQQVAGR